MESSAEYHEAVRRIEGSGVIANSHTTELFDLFGGFADEALPRRLATPEVTELLNDEREPQ